MVGLLFESVNQAFIVPSFSKHLRGSAPGTEENTPSMSNKSERPLGQGLQNRNTRGQHQEGEPAEMRVPVPCPVLRGQWTWGP